MDRCPLDLGRFSKPARGRVVALGLYSNEGFEIARAEGAKVTYYSLRRSANSKTIARSWKHHGSISTSTTLCCSVNLGCMVLHSIPLFRGLCARRYPFGIL